MAKLGGSLGFGLWGTLGCVFWGALGCGLWGALGFVFGGELSFLGGFSAGRLSGRPLGMSHFWVNLIRVFDIFDCFWILFYFFNWIFQNDFLKRRTFNDAVLSMILLVKPSEFKKAKLGTFAVW
jgi:hypothetical protein